MGLSDVLAYLSGASFCDKELRIVSTKTLQALAEHSHIVSTDNANVKERITTFLDCDEGSKVNSQFACRIEQTIEWINAVDVNASPGSGDPFDSVSIVKVLDTLCVGQYKPAQNLFASQSVDKPVNFIVLVVKYLSACSKRVSNISKRNPSLCRGIEIFYVWPTSA